MKNSVHCFIPFTDETSVKTVIDELRLCCAVTGISLLSTNHDTKACHGCNIIYIDNINSSATIKAIAAATGADYTLLYTKNTTFMPLSTE